MNKKDNNPPKAGKSPNGRFIFQGKPKDTKGTVLRLWNYLSKKNKLLTVVFLLVIISSVLTLTGPYLIGYSIDYYIIPKDYQGLIRIAVIMIFVYLTGSLTTFIQNYIMINVAQDAIKDLREDVINKLHLLPLKFFDQKSHGDIMSRVTNDVENISQVLNTSVTHIFSSIVILVGTIIMMFILSPILTAITVIIIPLVLIATGIIAKYTRKFFKDQQKNLGVLNGFIEERISGQKVVKIFGREEDTIREFEISNSELKSKAIKAQIVSGIIPPIMNIFNNLSFAIVAGFGGLLAIKGVITIGVIASFINYSKQFSRPLNEMANQINIIQSALAGTERIFEILDQEAESEYNNREKELYDIKGLIAFKNVYFGYENNNYILKNFNFKVNPGQTIALVGPTGAGKTTVVNLLTRFYDVQKGEITIDDCNIKNIKIESLRSSLGIVLQDTYLFSESIKENIKYGKLDAKDEEVERAAKLANAHNFIMKMKDGYNTLIDEDAGNLSQGQKQLLAIARTILANPSILVLDEATSNVDTRTEIHIQEAMKRLMEGRTSFVIAHRLTTIKNSDMILVVNDGHIVEKGNHQELINQKGFYYNLYSN